jgi:PD-(D/E)XK nuclease superfamily protein
MKKRKTRIIKEPKARGEWVESVFVARASEQGLAVSKPWGESRSFDFVVGRPGHFVGVQVKSTGFESGGGYSCAIKKNNQPYSRGSFDFAAVYVIPEDVWYLIPVNKLAGRETVTVCSDSTTCMYEAYREAWHLLREASQSGEGEQSEEAETGAEEAPSEEAGSIHPGNMQDRMKWIENRMRNWMEGGASGRRK